MAKFPKWRLRVYNPRTKKVTMIGTLPSEAAVRRVLREEHGGQVSSAVESSKKPRIYVQKVKGRRPNGTLITEHVAIDDAR